MSEFQFMKSQRVIVPADKAGAENVQGVVTANAVHLGREPHYEIQWPSGDTVSEKGNLITLYAEVSESELIKAQPPAMVTVEAACARASEVRAEATEMAQIELDKLRRHIARLEAAAKRRRKASRSRKRR